MVSHAEAGRLGGIAHWAKKPEHLRKKKPVEVPQLCICGCGQMTKGGTFCQGHDAKYKSKLIQAVLEGKPLLLLHGTYSPDMCMQILVERGWDKFLDAARRNRRSDYDKRKDYKASKESNAALVTMTMFEMKEARLRLIGIGRYGRSSGRAQIQIHRENAHFLATASDAEIEAEYPIPTPTPTPELEFL